MLTNRIAASLFFSLLSILIIGCTAILESDISEEQVEIILPNDGAQLTNTLVSFWWEPIENASNYKITFVEGTFAQPLRRAGEVILDASQTTYDSSFVSGEFEWSIVAFNSGYTTNSNIAAFSVGESATQDISSANLQLSQPESNASLNATLVDFSWEDLSGADSYFLQIAQPDFTDLDNVLESQLTSETNLQYENFAEGNYAWRVRGENANGVSPYSTFLFTIDLTAPAAPILIAPITGAMVELPIQLTWQSTAASFEVEVSSDSTFTAAGFSYTTVANNYSFEEGESGDQYYWKILAIDAAGNRSEYSDVSQFSIQ